MNTLLTWLILSLALLAGANPARAEMCESVGEYEYTYGDNESIMQAKQRCENMALRAAIEQCALFVASTTSIENYQLKDDLVNTLAAAVVKRKKVLEHRVEGRTIYYKVSIRLDDEQMTKAIEAEQRRLQPDTPAQAQQTPTEPVQAAPAQAAQTPTETVQRPAAQPPQSTQRPTPAFSAFPTTHAQSYVALQLGGKSVNKEDWEPLESQTMFALHLDLPLGGLPVSLSFDLLGSAKSGTISDGFYEYDATATSAELSAGLRYYFLPDAMLRPYAGAGLALVMGSLDFEGEVWQGSTIGFVANGGVVMPLGPLFVGLDLRLSTGKATMTHDEFDDIDAACGGTSFSLVGGFHW